MYYMLENNFSFMCTSCNEVFHAASKVCENCKKIFSIVKIPSSLIFEKKKNVASEILKNKAKGNFINGFEFMGQMSKNFKMIVHGVPGSGKSYFCFQLADAIANSSKKKTIYFTSEENLDSLDFQKKLIDCNISDKLHFESVENKKQFLAILREQNKKTNVILDSVTDLELSPKEVKDLGKEIKGIFVFILHVNKKGQHRGSTAYVHNSQIQIEVRKGIAATVKNRFGESHKEYQIFESMKNEPH